MMFFGGGDFPTLGKTMDSQWEEVQEKCQSVVYSWSGDLHVFRVHLKPKNELSNQFSANGPKMIPI